MNRLNAWLDRLPREYVWVSGRGVPAFRTCGIVGFHLAIALTLLGAVRIARPLTVALGMSLVCALSFFAWALLRRLVTGRETLVLLEHVWVAVACAAGYVAAVGEPVWPWMDVLAVSLCAFLAAGRIGCLLAGCCHGYPATTGIVYRRADHPYRDLRLFPVQLGEATALVLLSLLGFGWLGHTRPGATALTLAALYALIRFAAEGLRGDDRAHLFDVPVGRIMVCIQLVFVVGADEWLREPSPRPVRYVPVLLGLVLCALAGWAWRRSRPLVPAVVREVRTRASHGSTELVARPVGEGVSVAVGAGSESRHVSVAVTGAADGAASRVSAAALGCEPHFVSEHGIAHTAIGSPRRSYFDAISGPDIAASRRPA